MGSCALKSCNSQFVSYLLFILLAISALPAHAEKNYSASDVFSGVKYANKIVDKLLAHQDIKSKAKDPISQEVAAKPMHVYELHVSVLAELYEYAKQHDRRPPPIVISTPMKYTPTDVYFLTSLVIDNLEKIYKDNEVEADFQRQAYSNKTPTQVYQELFTLYHKLTLLNGKTKISPSEVYSQIIRAREDLQFSLLTLSRRLPNTDTDNKRMLMTAVYGMHPDGSVISKKDMNKKPSDVMEMALYVRNNLNVLRKNNGLKYIESPNINQFTDLIKPIDVFLQTQFIIAELNILKIPLKIGSATDKVKIFTGKTASDVYQEMKHIRYMLNRLSNVNNGVI